MMAEWQIDKDKEHVFLRDEGANMKKAFEEGGYLHADCGAHKLNRVVNNSLFNTPEIKSMLDNCRKLVGHFSHSNQAKERLKKEQFCASLPCHNLIQDVPTRWNSTYYMGARLLEQRTAIDLYLTRHQKRNLELTQEEWNLLSSVVKVLEPLEEALKLMCRDDEPISIQLPIARVLMDKIKEMNETGLGSLCESIIDKLSEKFNVEEKKIYGLATFLDPRFKDNLAQYRADFNSNVLLWLQEECEEGDLGTFSDVNPPSPKRANSFFGKYISLNSYEKRPDSQPPKGLIQEILGLYISSSRG